MEKIFSYLATISKNIKINRSETLNSTIKNSSDPFLTNAFQLIFDNISVQHLKEILNENIQNIQKRHLQGIMFFDTMANYAPSFWFIRHSYWFNKITLLTYIPKHELGQGMAIAMITTFYGLALANFIFLPISGDYGYC